MNIEEAREFYLDMGGNYADDIVRLGNEFDMVEAGLRLKSLANYSRSNQRSEQREVALRRFPPLSLKGYRKHKQTS